MLRVLQHQVSASVWPEAEARAEFRSQLKRRRGLSGLGWKFGNFKASHRGPCAVNFLGKKNGMIWSVQAKSLLYGDAKAIQQKREMLLRQGSEATESPRVFWWYFDVFGCLIIWWILMYFFLQFSISFLFLFALSIWRLRWRNCCRCLSP